MVGVFEGAADQILTTLIEWIRFVIVIAWFMQIWKIFSGLGGSVGGIGKKLGGLNFTGGGKGGNGKDKLRGPDKHVRTDIGEMKSFVRHIEAIEHLLPRLDRQRIQRLGETRHQLDEILNIIDQMQSILNRASEDARSGHGTEADVERFSTLYREAGDKVHDALKEVYDGLKEEQNDDEIELRALTRLEDQIEHLLKAVEELNKLDAGMINTLKGNHLSTSVADSLLRAKGSIHEYEAAASRLREDNVQAERSLQQLRDGLVQQRHTVEDAQESIAKLVGKGAAEQSRILDHIKRDVLEILDWLVNYDLSALAALKEMEQRVEDDTKKLKELAEHISKYLEAEQKWVSGRY